MKKCFITVAIGDKFKNLSKLTTPFMLDYCMNHDYDFFQIHNIYNHSEPAWARHELKYLLERYDVVFYADTDVVFLPSAPDLITLPELSKLDYDVSGALEPLKTYHLIDLKNYIEKTQLPRIDFKSHQYPYICSGCMILTKGFLKYYTNPPLPEVNGIKFRDQNALNYAIRSKRIIAKPFPYGIAGCPYLYHQPNDIKYIWHFNLSMNPNYPHYTKIMFDFINKVKKGEIT